MKQLLGRAAALAVLVMVSPAAHAAPGDWLGNDELVGGPNDPSAPRGSRVQGEGRVQAQPAPSVDARRAPPIATPQNDNFSRSDRDFSSNDRDWTRGGDRNDARFAPVTLVQLRNQIERGVDRGTISRREGRMLMSQVRDIQAMRDFYARGGINNWERAQLDTRMARLQDAVYRQSRDRGREYGWR